MTRSVANRRTSVATLESSGCSSRLTGINTCPTLLGDEASMPSAMLTIRHGHAESSATARRLCRGDEVGVPTADRALRRAEVMFPAAAPIARRGETIDRGTAPTTHNAEVTAT
jgi:hypothetical protein